MRFDGQEHIRFARRLAPTAVATAVLATAVVTGCCSPGRSPELSADLELRRLFREDQEQRAAIMRRHGGWRPTEEEALALLEADARRRARVDALDRAGRIRTPASQYHAAMILQHGVNPEDFRRAHVLAGAAAARGHEEARWLAAAALDRYLMSKGLPQKYGTQYKMVDGRWVLHEVDPSVTDEERREWNCPPLDEARRRVEEMNCAVRRGE